MSALAAPGGEAPEPGAEVRAAEHGVRRDAGPEHSRDGVGAAHSAPSDATSAGSSGAGPYGTSASSAPASPARQRAAIVRSVTSSAAPSSTYSASTTVNVTQMPLA